MKDSTGQFVLLEHTGPQGVHWDLMLEDETALLTWRLDTPPQRISQEPVKAQRIHDHALRFLEYEGPVQNNTGMVRRIDKGPCRWLRKDHSILHVVLNGTVLSGSFVFEHSNEQAEWLLLKTKT